MAHVEFELVYGHAVSDADGRRDPSLLPGIEALGILADSGDPAVGQSFREVGGHAVRAYWVGVVLGRFNDGVAYSRLSDIRLEPTPGQRAAVEGALRDLPPEARRAATANPPGVFLIPSHR